MPREPVTRISAPDAVAPRKRRGPLLAALAAVVALAACGDPATRAVPHDPLEGVNRAMHGVNKGLDTVALRPAATVYGTVVPSPLRRGVSNVAETLDHPGRVVNDVLQGQIEDAGHNLFRMLVNVSLGVFGLFDVATTIGLEERPSDFGETLHVWGAGQGAYLELPLLGPSTVRDTAGDVMDIALNPLSFAINTVPRRQAYLGVQTADVLQARSENGRLFDDVLYDSADSYVALRSAYLQNRDFTLGIAPPSDDLDFFDDPFLDPFAIPIDNMPRAIGPRR